MFSSRLFFASVLCSLSLAAAAPAQNQQSTKLKQPIATVDGQSIYEDELASTVQGQLLPLRNQEYDIKRKALDTLIEQKLLESAAKSKGITTEQLLAQNLDAKVSEPSDAEIHGFYMALRERVNRPLDEIKPQIIQALKQAQIQQARQDYMKSLREHANVAVLISAPRADVAFDPARVRGNPNAPVMIVEFSDYQCPYCHQAEPTVDAVLKKYGDKVSLSYRDYPLRAIHEHAEIAAEASRCALEQGKFWDYHDQLFKATNLDKEALIAYAKDAKLDEKQFDSCISSEKYKVDIDKDLEAGRKAGVTGTPAFFINGVELSGARGPENFSQAIDDELSRTPQKLHAAAPQPSSKPPVTISISRAEPH